MKGQTLKKVGWLGLVILFLLVFGSSGQAVQAAGAGFTVAPQLPANQIGGDTGWFDLLVKPGQEQELPVMVANQADGPKRLRLTLTNAYTQANGQIGYKPNTQRDPSARLQLTTMGSKPVTIELPPHTQRRVVFRVTVPAAGFEGQVLGAIYAEDQTPTPPSNRQGLTITNQFAMVIAVQLQTQMQPPAPDLRLPVVTATATGVQARLQNPNARLFGKINLVAKLVAKDTGQTVVTQRERNYQMAPNSNFTYQLQPEKDLPAGDYQVQITATAGKRHWQLQRDLNLKTPVTAVLPPSTPAPRTFNWWWLSPIGILGVLAIGVWLGRRQNR